MPRTKRIIDENTKHITEDIKEAKNMYAHVRSNELDEKGNEEYIDDNIVQELAKGGLDLPPYSEGEDDEIMNSWISARNEVESKKAIVHLWKDWFNRHPNETIEWIPDYVKEADGLSPTASGKEGEDLPGFSSGEFPSSIHPVEEEEASAEAPWSLKELLEEDSFTISSIDQMEEEESVGVLPNLSEVVGEMSAPTSSRVNREMSAPIVSSDNREMSALNIPDATWMAAIKGACQANIQTRKSIIAEVLKPQFVMPSIGSKEWRCLEVLLNLERKRYDVSRRLSPNVETRENAQRMKIILDKFSKDTGCGDFAWSKTKEKKRYVKTLLKDI